MVFMQSIIFIISIFGFFFIIYFLTDDTYIEMKKDGKKILDVYTENLDKKSIDLLVKELEKSKELGHIVDIINIHERFDKRK